MAALESLTFFECKLTNERHCWVARQPGHFINLFMHVSLHLRLLICNQLDRDTKTLQYQYCQGGRHPRCVVTHFKISRIVFRTFTAQSLGTHHGTLQYVLKAPEMTSDSSRLTSAVIWFYLLPPSRRLFVLACLVVRLPLVLHKKMLSGFLMKLGGRLRPSWSLV